MAEDVGRYLLNQPVEATPPSVVYRFSKFAKRNKGWFATGAIVLLALLIGLVSTSYMAVVANRARKLALMQSQRAHEASEQAEYAKQKAQRSAIIAGTSPLLPEDEATGLANVWRSEIERLQADSSADQKELAQQEAYFATWYGTWLLQRSKPREALKVLAGYYDHVKQVLGRKNAPFFGVSNANIQAHVLSNAAPAKIAPLYEDIVVAMEHVHGPNTSLQLYPEHASVLANADQGSKAAEVLRKYLKLRSDLNTPLAALDKRRIDMALDGLTAWSSEFPDLYEQLKEFRATGNVTSDDSDDEVDPELAKDLETLQGAWGTDDPGGVSNAVRMEQTVDGNSVAVKLYDADGKVVYGRGGTIRLSRSGACKVYTLYFAGDAYAESAFIYIIEDDQLKLVSGMLAGRDSQPGTALRVLKRVVADNE